MHPQRLSAWRTSRADVSGSVIGALMLALALGGCSDGTADPAPPPASLPAQPTRSTANDAEAVKIRELAEAGEEVSVETSDGVRLEGLAFGSGSSALVLSHMGRTGDNLEDWLVAATELAKPARTVLVYNRRGVCSRILDLCSDGFDTLDESWRDVVAADRFVRERDSDRVVLAGASIGAMATFHAASGHAVNPDGLIWFGGVLDGEYTFTEAIARRLPPVPILYLSAVDDTYGGGRAARRMHEWTRSRSRLALVPGTEHGTDLIEVGADHPRRERVMTEVDRLWRRIEQQ